VPEAFFTETGWFQALYTNLLPFSSVVIRPEPVEAALPFLS
jgi:hypothetical protein